MVWVVSLSTMAIRRHCLTPFAKGSVFGVYQESVGREDPLIQTVALPPIVYKEAAPKGISKRTSYLRVRLAFHPYPQVIPASCDMRGCGPPVVFRLPSPCPWVAHPVSGLVHAIINALFGLAFAPAPGFDSLSRPHTANSLVRSTKSTQSPV